MKKVLKTTNKKTDKEFITGAAKKEPKSEGPKTIKEKNTEIKAETIKGKTLIKKAINKSWRNPKQDSGSFLVGEDVGVLSWLTPLVCQFFGFEDVGYRSNLRVWNHPPSIDNPKKKHEIARQYYCKPDEKYLLIDVFSVGTSQNKIDLIKAWMEALGYNYTYIMGNDYEENASKPEKFMELIFKTRLKAFDPKSKDYPKFKIPKTYLEAGLHYGSTTFQGAAV